MRCAAAAVFLILMCSVASAQEIELKAYTTDFKSPVQTTESKDLRYDTATQPEGAKAPEGELDWGSLTLGKRSYLVCAVLKDGKHSKLYLDADGDKDLAEEKPVAVRDRGGIPFFDLEGVEGEFKVGTETLSVKMRLSVTPVYGGYVFSCTAYAGEFKIGDGSFAVVWVPTNAPLVRPTGWEFGVPTLYYGKHKVTVQQKDIAIKDGNVKASYKVAEEEELAELDAPKGLSFVMLYGRNFYAAFLPSGGKLHLTKGTHNTAVASFRKEREGKRYELRVMLSSQGGYEVKDDTKIGEAEPLKLTPSVEVKGSSISVTASLLDARKRDVAIGRDGEPIPPPKLKITDPNGKEAAAHEFVPG